ncbi:MAG: PaaI family thioesterase [Arenicellales bacterium]|nr:PaaI family thioesterase [Arenicellales bacterium]
MSQATIAEIQSLTREQLPFALAYGFRLEALDSGTATVRAPYSNEFLRPGGTISGPVMMGLADYALYAAVLSCIGIVELAVTTNLNINFLHRPEPGDLLAYARIIKLGKRLAVGEVEMFVEGEEELVAHVTATYSIPPGSVVSPISKPHRTER